MYFCQNEIKIKRKTHKTHKLPLIVYLKCPYFKHDHHASFPISRFSRSQNCKTTDQLFLEICPRFTNNNNFSTIKLSCIKYANGNASRACWPRQNFVQQDSHLLFNIFGGNDVILLYAFYTKYHQIPYNTYSNM